MPLDKDKFKADLQADLESKIAQSIQEVEPGLNDLLKDENGGFRTALANIKNRVQLFSSEGHSAADFMPFIQTIVSEEYAKAISNKLVESLAENWAPKISEAIASAVSDRVDSFLRSADIVVPSGSKVLVPIAGPSAGNGTVVEDSQPAEIN